MACGPWTLRNLQGVWLDPSVGEYGHAIMLLVAMTTALHTPLSLWLDGRSAPTSAPALFDRRLLAPDDSAAAAAEPNSRPERF